MEVREATEADYPSVARIQAACPEAAQWPLGDYSAYRVLLAQARGVAVGFCAWRQSTPDEAELLNLAVHPDHRRRGVARALLNALSVHAGGDLFLEVAETNQPARLLYAANGWKETGLRKDYYASGRNAIVMRRSSC